MDSNPQSDAVGEAIVPILACVLQQLCSRNDQLPASKDNITKFHALRPPSITLQEYLQRLLKYTCCSGECYVLSLIYIDRLIASNVDFIVSSLNVHRLLITSIMMAAKFFDDQYFNNSYYAKVGGISTDEINHLEVEFVFLCNFTLYVSTDTYTMYYNELRNHAINMQNDCQCRNRSVPELQLPPELLQESYISKMVLYPDEHDQAHQQQQQQQQQQHVQASQQHYLQPPQSQYQQQQAADSDEYYDTNHSSPYADNDAEHDQTGVPHLESSTETDIDGDAYDVDPSDTQMMGDSPTQQKYNAYGHTHPPTRGLAKGNYHSRSTVDMFNKLYQQQQQQPDPYSNYNYYHNQQQQQYTPSADHESTTGFAVPTAQYHQQRNNVQPMYQMQQQHSQHTPRPGPPTAFHRPPRASQGHAHNASYSHLPAVVAPVPIPAQPHTQSHHYHQPYFQRVNSTPSLQRLVAQSGSVRGQ